MPFPIVLLSYWVRDYDTNRATLVGRLKSNHRKIRPGSGQEMNKTLKKVASSGEGKD
jgi:hypothetical protein